MLMTYIPYHYDIPPYEPLLQFKLTIRIWPIQHFRGARKIKKDLLRVAKLINLAPRSRERSNGQMRFASRNRIGCLKGGWETTAHACSKYTFKMSAAPNREFQRVTRQVSLRSAGCVLNKTKMHVNS